MSIARYLSLHLAEYLLTSAPRLAIDYMLFVKLVNARGESYPRVSRHLPQRSFYFWQKKITRESLFPNFALPNYPGHLLKILKIF
jgi:hypothetical protein